MQLAYNIDFELVTIVYMIIINIFLHLQYTTRSEVNRQFIRLANIVLSANVVDVLTAITISYGSVVPLWVNTLLNTFYFVLDLLVGYFFMKYVVAYVKAGRKSFLYKANAVVCWISILNILVNIFTGHVFYFNALGEYIHGPLYLLVYIVPYYYIVASAGIMFYHYRQFQRKQRVAISVFFILASAGPLAQMLFFPDVLLSVFSIALGQIVLIYSLETPDYQLLMETLEELHRLQANLEQEVSRQTGRAERLSRQALRTLAVTIDAKDRYTNGHSVRVAEYAREIARRYGMPEKEQEKIYYMGLLHDIGKIGVPDNIINKDTRLTEEEYEMIKRHPEIGADILKSISEDIPDVEVGARWHHERYDGKGYPDRLAGEQIPLVARIIGVADAYDAMTSNRRYRKALPQQVVRKEFVENKGLQFDPVFAELMLEMIDEDTEYEMREK